MLKSIINKFTSLVKEFNQPLNCSEKEIDSYLNEKGIVCQNTEKVVKVEKKVINNKESIREEIKYEKESDFVFHIFRTYYNNDKIRNDPNAIIYLRTCTLTEVDSFFKKIGFKNFVARKK